MKIWFTLTGTNHYFGQEFLEKGMKIRLEKEPDNRHDREAIKVLLDGVGHIGYVANSPYTVIGESYSAGRLYDKIGDTAKGKVKLITDRGVLCTLKQKKDDDPVPPEGEENGSEQEDTQNGQPDE
ncbi:MAG: HIRAN domain-containing protein [Clostridiales bacterium]|nr:HIRAN domain-containing protein [Clostridiales bacterium]